MQQKCWLVILEFMPLFYCKQRIVYITGYSIPHCSLRKCSWHLIFLERFFIHYQGLLDDCLHFFLGQFICTFTSVCQVLTLYSMYISQYSFGRFVHLHTHLWILLIVRSQQLAHLFRFILVPAGLSAMWHCHIFFLLSVFMYCRV